jgi:uncharacterized protein YndB with AHSA1/START domain
MKKNEKPIVVEQTFQVTIDTVWKAITDIKQMRLWYFDNIPDFKPEVGFKTQFNVQSGERNFMHKWKVTEVVSRRKITYNWQYENYAGDAFVTFELFEQNDQTTLRLINQIVEDFQDNIPEFTRESCVGGWTYFIKKNLKEFLDKID